ncbi:hypothetical protein OSB04_006985 [Centaurea solstitialis]|uniref:Retrovirus-related Pol polyprotein from transposon TNT 1-94 n=1 Tax=Centaurea solstitialis TaxID=347529 RepID=A0AA38TIZ7_9ASTR|nr:hypothetical protein OSB04_006985 [Centaurea solstitialis]
MRTPMATGLRLHKDLSGTSVECKLYRGMIRSLLYLTASRPDIMFATCLCARFQSDPKESHLSVVKRILRYLKKTPTLGLWRKTCKFVFKEAELCVHIHCRGRICCCCKLSFNKIPILCDSKSAIAISANPVQHSKTKHTDIRYHFLKHNVEEGNVEMYFVNTENQLADLFTKGLDEKRFNFLVGKLGMFYPD